MRSNLTLYTLLALSAPLFIQSMEKPHSYSDKWTADQIKTAHTAIDVTYMGDVEKEVILYINLARMYPKQFAEYELSTYNGPAKYGDYLKDSKFKKSLLDELKKQKPMAAVKPDKFMTEDAVCFASEIGKSGAVTHTRKVCKKNNFAECCSFGMSTGKDIALQLLIDHDVASLGHRKICLDASYSKAGVGFKPHKKWGDCCVLEII